MKFFKMLFAFVVVSLLGTIPTFAQESAGIALAKVATPSELMVQTLPGCVRELVDIGVRPKDALKSCEKRYDRESKRSERVSGNAARANQPQIVYGGGGYSYSSYDYGYGRPTRYSAGNNRRISSGRSASYRTPN